MEYWNIILTIILVISIFSLFHKYVSYCEREGILDKQQMEVKQKKDELDQKIAAYDKKIADFDKELNFQVNKYVLEQVHIEVKKHYFRENEYKRKIKVLESKCSSLTKELENKRDSGVTKVIVNDNNDELQRLRQENQCFVIYKEQHEKLDKLYNKLYSVKTDLEQKYNALILNVDNYLSTNNLLEYYKSLEFHAHFPFKSTKNSIVGFINSFTVDPDRLEGVYAKFRIIGKVDEKGNDMYYTTSLYKCDCASYQFNSARPCKHMFFLANYLYSFIDVYKSYHVENSQTHNELRTELNKYKSNYDTYRNKYAELESVMSVVEGKNGNVAMLFKNLIAIEPSIKDHLMEAYLALTHTELDL